VSSSLEEPERTTILSQPAPSAKIGLKECFAALERPSAVLDGTTLAWRPTPDFSKGSRLPRIVPQCHYVAPPRPRIAPQCYIVATQRPESRLSATILPLSGTISPLSALRTDFGLPRDEFEGRRGEVGQERGNPVARRARIGESRGGIVAARGSTYPAGAFISASTVAI
jgi:hypothetical protein